MRIRLMQVSVRLEASDYRLIVVVADNDVGWLLSGAVFSEDFYLAGLLIEPRIHIRLLISRRKVIVHPIRASIIAIVNIRQHILVVAVRLRDDISKVEIAVRIVAVHQNVPMIMTVEVVRRRLIALILIIVACACSTAAARSHQHLVVVGNLQVERKRWIAVIC